MIDHLNNLSVAQKISSSQLVFAALKELLILIYILYLPIDKSPIKSYFGIKASFKNSQMGKFNFLIITAI